MQNVHVGVHGVTNLASTKTHWCIHNLSQKLAEQAANSIVQMTRATAGAASVLGRVCGRGPVNARSHDGGAGAGTSNRINLQPAPILIGLFGFLVLADFCNHGGCRG
jgi:hypothetical protein